MNCLLSKQAVEMLDRMHDYAHRFDGARAVTNRILQIRLEATKAAIKLEDVPPIVLTAAEYQLVQDMFKDVLRTTSLADGPFGVSLIYGLRVQTVGGGK